MARTRSGHRFGYLLAIALNAVFFYLVNVRPGWQAVPFLTSDTPQVLRLLNLSVLAGMAINTGYLLHDAPWCKALGDFVLSLTGLAVLLRMGWVFPFTFTGWQARLIHAILAVAIAATAIAMIANISLLVRHSAGKEARR
jgi:hypothetical protein